MRSLATAVPSNPTIPITGTRTRLPVGATAGRIHGISMSWVKVIIISSTMRSSPTVRLSDSMDMSAAFRPTNHRR
ncbi:hypothetical protein ACFQQB_18560 [Nonomuraea rubra]|uniref:hypothetical protein n=1 Tax=Nonomuraea rubra TaxID=46180 RepID=UPI00361598AF